MSPEDRGRDVTEPRFQASRDWVCGHSELGFACTGGPSANGKCGHLPKTCTQSSGGTDQAVGRSNCESCAHTRRECAADNDPPSPSNQCDLETLPTCIPIRSARSFRGSLARNFALATAGGMLLIMALPQREAAFVPGGLSSKHAQILDNRLVTDRCSLCHPNSHSPSLITGQNVTQDELCARCHEGHLPGLQLRSPHDLERSTLKQLTLGFLAGRGRLVATQTSLIDRTAAASSLSPPAPDFAGMLASSEVETTCASCHAEHHGRKHDLQAIADQRCQACHVAQFASFGEGHPEFENYPEAQPRRIAFTHSAHLEKHFAKKNETFECAKCHVDSDQRGGVGAVFRTLGFEAACARCHSSSIDAAAGDGWVMLQLPSIQPRDAMQPSLGLSDWPSTAQFGYEGSVPLAMRSLLTADPKVRPFLFRLPESGEIKSLPDFATTGRETAQGIAVATRELIREIAANGQQAWRQRLEQALRDSLERELATREIQLVAELCAGLPPDVFRQMEQNWFADALSDVVQDNDSPGPAAELVSARQEDDLLLSPEAVAPSDPSALLKEWEQDPASASTDDLLQSPARDHPPASGRSSEQGRPKLTKLRGAVHVAEGGWYLDNETLSLRYMSRGHSDRTLAAWAEFATLTEDATEKPSLARQVPGDCAQCHVLGKRHDAVESPNASPWIAYSKPATARALTKFDHTPHLTLPALFDCKYCHQLQSASASTALSPPSSTVSVIAPARAVANAGEFKALHIQQCTGCHRPNAASIGCTQCHNYHVAAPKQQPNAIFAR